MRPVPRAAWCAVLVLAAGACHAPAVRSWTVDLTPPDTTLAGGPSGTVPFASASFSFTASESEATFACSLDGGAFAPCTSPDAVTGLAQGAHTFAVRATDAAGHTDPSPASRSWTVDTSAPAPPQPVHRMRDPDPI